MTFLRKNVFESDVRLLFLQMMEEEWVESEEVAEVQVLVLSPRCWAVSSLCFLDDPTKYFPAELCSYLNQFTQFYSHSEFQAAAGKR